MGRKAVKSNIEQDIVRFEVTREKPFNVAVITKVYAEMYTSGDEEKPRLTFEITSPDGKRKQYYSEREITDGMGKMSADQVTANQDRKIAHVYNAFMGDGAHAKASNGHEIGTTFDEAGNALEESEEWIDFFKAVAKAFNEGRDGKPVYLDKDGKPIPFWIKLTYDNKNKPQVPLFGNFISLWVKGQKPLLEIDETYDKVEKAVATNLPKTAVNPSNIAPAGGADDIPGFDF